MKNKRKSGLKWILAVWFCGISAMADAQVTEGLKAIGMENIRCAQTPGMTTVSFENNVYRSTYTGVGKAIDACLGSKTKGDLQLVVLENRIPRLCINLPDTLTEAYRNGEINLTQVYQQMGITVDVEAAQNETSAEEAATTTTVSVPAQAAEEGTTIAAVTYEEPKASTSEEVAETPKEEAVPVTAVAIKVTPEDAVAKAPIEIKTAVTGSASTGSYFDPASMEALKDAVVTRAAVHFGDVTYKDGNYVITIPEGEKIQGKYLTNILPSKTVSKIQQGGYNTVNGENGVIKIENRDYSALTATLKVITKCGWDYTTTPEAALQAVGASKGLASVIEKCITNAEGSKNGYYTVEKELKTAISGNNQLVFGSRSKTQTKTYTFPVFVNGAKKQVVVQLNCYTGYTEEYSNTPINKHSGGTTGK